MITQLSSVYSSIDPLI